MIYRWWARRKCHGNTICCQFVDLPTCNSVNETHRRGRRWFQKVNRL